VIAPLVAAAYSIFAGREDQLLEEERNGFVSILVVEGQSGNSDTQHRVKTVAA